MIYYYDQFGLVSEQKHTTSTPITNLFYNIFIQEAQEYPDIIIHMFHHTLSHTYLRLNTGKIIIRYYPEIIRVQYDDERDDQIIPYTEYSSLKQLIETHT